MGLKYHCLIPAGGRLDFGVEICPKNSKASRKHIEFSKMSTPEILVLVGEIIIAILFIFYFTTADMSSSGVMMMLVKSSLARFLMVAIIAVIVMYNIPIGFMLGLVYLSLIFRASAYESFAVHSLNSSEEEGTDSDSDDDEEAEERLTTS